MPRRSVVAAATGRQSDTEREAFQRLIARLATHHGHPDAKTKCARCAELREQYHQDLIERRLRVPPQL
jgi:hypothetical protein